MRRVKTENYLKDATISIFQASNQGYPCVSPFHPDRFYPEYQFGGEFLSESPNPVYDAVRESFHLLGLDKENFGTLKWNPFGEFISPGDKVLVKPNWVLHENHGSGGLECMITHTSVIRVVVDYAVKALQDKGRILIADAPQWDASFDKIIESFGTDGLIEFYRKQGIAIKIVDLRSLRVKIEHGLVVSRKLNKHQAVDSRIVNLGVLSEFESLGQKQGKLFGSDYDPGETRSHHQFGIHKYCVSKELLEADVIINLPKLKTHQKAGITVAMKNLVGINTNKNFLPHYSVGEPSLGGDEFPKSRKISQKIGRRMIRWGIENLLARYENGFSKVARIFLKVFSRIYGLSPSGKKDYSRPGYNNKVIEKFYQVFADSSVRAGNWLGNDTVWRMIIDLNKIALYSNKKGQIQPKPQRVHFCVVDGIVGGQGNGPLSPDPISSRVIFSGFNPFCVDFVASLLMGFEPDKIPFIKNTQKVKNSPIYSGKVSEIKIVSNRKEWIKEIKPIDALKFRPPKNWERIKTWTSD